MTIMSKYANLPDVDVDSPDTFENHVLSHPSIEPLADDPNVNVETAPLNMKSATNTFKAKEKMAENPFIWNSESKAQRLHFLSLQLYNLREQFQEISLEEDTQNSYLSKIRSLESDIQAAMSSAIDAKSNSWNVVDGVESLCDSLSKEPSKAEGPIVFELYSKPGKITDSDQFIELESRVSMMEKILGASIHQPHTDLKALNIINTLEKLNSQIGLLTDTDFQNQTIKRLESLNLDTKMDQNSEKLEVMHEFLNSEYVAMVPQILSRLVTLKKVHDTSIQMVKRFKELEETVELDHQIINDVRKDMSTFENVIKDNSRDIQDNISKIMERFKKLEIRIQKLSSV